MPFDYQSLFDAVLAACKTHAPKLPPGKQISIATDVALKLKLKAMDVAND